MAEQVVDCAKGEILRIPVRLAVGDAGAPISRGTVTAALRRGGMVLAALVEDDGIEVLDANPGAGEPHLRVTVDVDGMGVPLGKIATCEILVDLAGDSPPVAWQRFWLNRTR